MDLAWNGAVFAGLNIVAALSSWSAPRLLRRFNAVVIFNVLGLLVAGSLFVMGIAIPLGGGSVFFRTSGGERPGTRGTSERVAERSSLVSSRFRHVMC